MTGVSLGGLFTLRLAEHFDLERIAVMSAHIKSVKARLRGVLKGMGIE